MLTAKAVTWDLVNDHLKKLADMKSMPPSSDMQVSLVMVFLVWPHHKKRSPLGTDL